MLAWLWALPLQRAAVLCPAYVLACGLLAFCVLPVVGVRGRGRVRLGWVAAAAGMGALAGLAVAWAVIDLDDVFGAPADAVVWVAAAAGGAGIGVGAANLVRVRWWRRGVAVLAIAATTCAAGLMINRDVAYYPTLGDVLGESPPQQLVLTGDNESIDADLSTWRGPTGMPTKGQLDLATIPGRDSRFHARQAWVYRPPAALVRNPPELPVVIALTGEPGEPSDVFQATGLRAVLDGIAARHHGVAPIVVSADQLGGYDVNPMCVDSAMGDVATYITDDVRTWVLRHLPVSRRRHDWAVMGFSEGATCAVQFGTGYPAVFGSYIAVAPELGPIDGDLPHTLREAFDGSEDRWDAAQPIAIMQRERSYPDTRAVYSVGADDPWYGSVAPALAAESRKVGMHADFSILPGVAHNWNTGAQGFADGLNRLLPWWGIRS